MADILAYAVIAVILAAAVGWAVFALISSSRSTQAATSGQSVAATLEALTEQDHGYARELQRAIEEGGLVIHFQPKIDLRRGVIDEVEALVRWNHPERGLLGPGEFLPLAERAGLSGQIGEWVLDNALAQCASWYIQGFDIGVSVNVSAHELFDPGLPDTVSAALARHDVSASRLMLEISERTIMQDTDAANLAMSRLDALGVQLAIDDFGSGKTSMSYLEKLPVKSIKIDKSFVMEMESNSDNEMIVRSTIDLGHDLGLGVTSAGVESDGILNRLQELGCDTVQGYYMSMPLNESDFGAWMIRQIDDNKMIVKNRQLLMLPT